MSASKALVVALRDAVPVPTGVTRDPGCRVPIKYAAMTLYAWMLPETFAEQSPDQDRDDFTVLLTLTASSTEDSTQAIDPAVTDFLYDGAEAITDWVRGNRQDHAHTPQLWDDLQARVMWPGLRGFGWASVPVELSGFRFVS